MQWHSGNVSEINRRCLENQHHEYTAQKDHLEERIRKFCPCVAATLREPPVSQVTGADGGGDGIRHFLCLGNVVYLVHNWS